ncbi:NADH dehydrogenase [ubiquinone] 1 beta subcomplex subunit 3 isoform X2 [Cephus cinctus]|nr:NADH dehydrogenase [ubiquinone] 1 beta subcomplex subunit 3 isoform X2 [Cephus cinctus]
MGGHGHGHEPPYKVPSPDIYKVEDVPQLVKVQQKLAKLGLKDPWLRNEVWRYDKSFGKSVTSRVLTFFFRGWKFAVPAFLLTIGIEHALGISDHHGQGHGEEHDEHH